MPISIPSGLTDDNDFIAMFNRLLNGLTGLGAPEELWVIQIDNWFDHKWLRFSGNGAVTPDIPLGAVLSVKREFWQDKLTFPPFTPDRVVGQWSFKRIGEGYIEFPMPRLPHKTRRQNTEDNLHKRIGDFAGSALFVWFSGNSLKNGRASVMAYDVTSPEPVCWFAGFARAEGWKVERTKGIALKDVLRLVTAG